MSLDDKVISFPVAKPTPVEEPPAVMEITPERAATYEAINRTMNFLFANKDNLDTFALVAILPSATGEPSTAVMHSNMDARTYSYLIHSMERDFMLNAFLT